MEAMPAEHDDVEEMRSMGSYSDTDTPPENGSLSTSGREEEQEEEEDEDAPVLSKYVPPMASTIADATVVTAALLQAPDVSPSTKKPPHMKLIKSKSLR